MKIPRWDRRTIYRYATFVLAFLCFFLIVEEIFGNHGWLALRREKKEFESLAEQIDRLKQENQQLEEQVKALRSDPKAIEKQAREQLHLARPGEIILTLPEKDPKTQPPPTEKPR